MKDAVTSNLKDNLASAIVLAAAFIGICGSAINSDDASANSDAVAQQLDAIVVTAPRMQVVTLDTIVVKASRTN